MEPASNDLIALDGSRLRPAGELLARAFDGDPMMECLLPDQRGRAARAAWLLGACVRFGMLYGTVYTTAGLDGVSIWIPPGQTRMGLWRMARAGFLAAPLRLGWSAFRKFVYLDRLTERLHHRLMPGPHWYLFILAVDPSRQGRGLGRAMLQRGFAVVDQEGLPVYLETTKPQNVPYYQEHGFKVLAEEPVPKLAVRLWAMARPPRGTTTARST